MYTWPSGDAASWSLSALGCFDCLFIGLLMSGHVNAVDARAWLLLWLLTWLLRSLLSLAVPKVVGFITECACGSQVCSSEFQL